MHELVVLLWLPSRETWRQMTLNEMVVIGNWVAIISEILQALLSSLYSNCTMVSQSMVTINTVHVINIAVKIILLVHAQSRSYMNSCTCIILYSTHNTIIIVCIRMMFDPQQRNLLHCHIPHCMRVYYYNNIIISIVLYIIWHQL